MRATSPRPGRHSIRLDGWDYTSPGAYFVTLVTYQRECLFGDIVSGEVRLSEAGQIAYEEWFQTAHVRPYVHLEPDEFVIMPDHIHGIIWIADSDEEMSDPASEKLSPSGVRAQRRCAPTGEESSCAPTEEEDRAPIGVTPGSLGAIVRAYKSAVTYRINQLSGTRYAPIWQRNFYEHIIRCEDELAAAGLYPQQPPSLAAKCHRFSQHRGPPMTTQSSTIVRRVWNYGNVLRGNGVRPRCSGKGNHRGPEGGAGAVRRNC